MYRSVKTLLVLHALRRIAQAMSLSDSIPPQKAGLCDLEGAVQKEGSACGQIRSASPENCKLASRRVMCPNHAIRSVQPNLWRRRTLTPMEAM